MNFSDIKNIHFVGIGGIGMSGIAEILATMGVPVSGCDLKRSAATDLLGRRGIRVAIGHNPEHLDGVDLVVVTAAVHGENAEIDAAHHRGIKVMRRSEMLGAIVNEKRAVGVAGTHGKTTTSAMIATVLEEAGLDPTIIVGGMVRNFATNAKTGAGEFLVVEADEYDRTFHHLHPEVAVVTNIEADHLEYFGSFAAIKEAFRVFIQGVKPGGVVVACSDDAGVREVIPSVARDLGGGRDETEPPSAPGFLATLGMTGAPRIITYGFSDGADLQATRLRFMEGGCLFDIAGVSAFRLFVPGEHNVRNALAAIAVGRELGIDIAVIARGLARFLGVDRRFQILGYCGGAVVVDDYAHHPTEIRATLEAARSAYPDRRIIALFQPHLYSRTRDFATEFAESLRVADVALVAPIYAAREEPVAGITGKLIADAAEGIEFLDSPNTMLVEQIRERLQPDDLFVTMGAGDVHQISEALVRGRSA